MTLYNKLLLCGLLLFSFGLCSIAQEFPDEDWQFVQQPVFEGWDQGGLYQIHRYLTDSTLITGMMLIQDGKVIYKYGDIEENSYIASCRKSVLAMLYGKYVTNGQIDLDKNLDELEIDKLVDLLENEKEATVHDIISCRSGVYLPASNAGDMSDDAPKRGSKKPGEFWLYSNWDFNVAGHIFEQLSGKNIYDDIETQFAKPLGMQDWDRSLQEKSGDYTASDFMAYHMWFSTRDMARLGLLMLNKGKWKDQQIIHEDWVKNMTTPKTSFEELDKIAPDMKENGDYFSYGYMWWLWEHPENKRLKGAYSALGAWGQNITVIPEMNCVVAIKTNAEFGRRKGNHSTIMDLVTKAYDPDSKAISRELSSLLQAEDVSGFVKTFRAQKFAQSGYDFENLLNGLGYHYLEEKQYEEALQIFKLNVETYPDAWNLYDSLGEGYLMLGKYEASIENFEKAVAMNPDNQYGNNDRVAMILDRIRFKMKQ